MKNCLEKVDDVSENAIKVVNWFQLVFPHTGIHTSMLTNTHIQKKKEILIKTILKIIIIEVKTKDGKLKEKWEGKWALVPMKFVDEEIPFILYICMYKIALHVSLKLPYVLTYLLYKSSEDDNVKICQNCVHYYF